MMMRIAAATICLMLSLGLVQAAEEFVLRPDLPAGEEWYTPPAADLAERLALVGT